MIPRIREVHLRNYKSIGDAVVRLSDFNVLVGPNGSGKTNFMDALAFMRDCLHMPVAEASTRHGGVTRVRTEAEREARFGCRIVVDMGSTTVDYGFELAGEHAELNVVAERCTVSDGSGVLSEFAVDAGHFVQAVDGVRPTLDPNRLALYAVSGTSEFRPVYDFIAGIKKYSISPGLLRGLQQAGPVVLLEDGENAAAVLLAVQKDSPDDHSRIARLLSAVVPDVTGVNAIQFGGSTWISFTESGANASEVPPLLSSSDMSDGTLRMLGLLLAVFQPFAPTVLQIEEPEANIHPAAAEVVMSVLMNAARRSQVIISTHSPDILDYKDLPGDSILVVSKERGKTRIEPLGSASRATIRRHLSTPGELLRIDELHGDDSTARLSPERNFFAPAGPAGEAA